MDAQSTENGQSGLKRRLGRGLTALLGGGYDNPSENGPTVIRMVPPVDDAHGPQATPAPIQQHTTELNQDSDGASQGPAGPSPASDEISLELIERNPFQPRRDFDQSALDELADSIRKHGILQPLLVRSRPDGEAGYQLIAGERRWRAAQQIGLETVPCRVIGAEDRQASEAALEENLKREDLNVLEKARAFRDYLERFGGTIEDLARQLSLNRATVSNMMRLLELPEGIQQMIRDNRLTGGHAKAILPLPEAQQAELAQRIASEEISVRHTEEIVRDLLKNPVPADNPETAAAGTAAKPALSNHVLSLQDHLRSHLGARIDIRLRKNEAGQIVIHFGNNDDFERIVGRLRQAG